MIFVRFLTVISLCAPFPVAANVVVTEIMYDLAEGSDSGHEWIEVYATEAIDLTKLKLVENGSNHKIVAEASGFVPAGAYVVIADNPTKFRNDHPNYLGLLFDSAFSLNNDGESITIADAAGNPLDSVSYTNASGNGTGDSLQRNPGANQFASGIPTPGLGIPTSGLVQSAPPLKKSKKGAILPSQPEIQKEIRGESNFPSSSPPRVMAAAAASGVGSLWWFAPLLIAGVAAGGISLSRHAKKSEWDIIEETEETS